MASSVARRVAQRVLASPGASTAARAAWSAGQPTPETHPDLLQPGELLPGLAAAEFAARRAALAALLPPGAVALLPAAPITYMAGGCSAPACCCCARGATRDAAPCLVAACQSAGLATHPCSADMLQLQFLAALPCRRRGHPLPLSPVSRLPLPDWHYTAVRTGCSGL